MSDKVFEKFRLWAMTDFLPIGVALVKRVRKKGSAGLRDIFSSTNYPFQDLRSEGEADAKFVRDQLDEFNPGLGNPVMSVEVEINDNEPAKVSNHETQELMVILNNIEHLLNSDNVADYFEKY